MECVYQQIEKAASPKDCRANLREPYFDGKRLIATNGHIMAIVRTKPSDGFKDDKGHVPAEILKAARKKNSHVLLNGTAQAPVAGLSLPRPDLGDFLRPSAIAAVIKGARRNTIKVAINAQLLLDLAKALNDSTSRYSANVELHISATDSGKAPIFVKSSDGKNYGAIMPVKL